LKNIKRILIIQTAFIGDVILTTPLIEALSKKYHQSNIDFVTIPKSEDLLKNNPHIKNLIIFDKKDRDRGIFGLLKFSKRVAGKNYDICITPHRSFRSAFLTFRTAAKIRVGFDRTAWKKAFTHLVTYRDDFHEIERNLSLLSAIGIKSHISAPVIYSSDTNEHMVDSILKDFGIKKNNALFAVAPGSIWPTKRWPEEYYTSFCRLMEKKGKQILLIGGREDQDLCQRIVSQCYQSRSIAGRLTLQQTYSLLRRCVGLLTNDSAPLHLGMAAKIPVFAIFGPTSPAFGFAPFGPKSYVIENETLACRPCAIHGGNKCPLKTFECMESLKPQEVADKINTLIYS
jgi:heptosyltransferase-2